ncbi:MAG: COX15/CtaA family protein [Phycisphaeraceae bacterium]
MPPATPAPAGYRPWLHRFAIAMVVATFALVTIGGNVTSLAAGLAVPEGWWTFDYFTPWAPLSVWWEDQGTRWEHSHRLKGYVVGLMAIGLAMWLWVTQRPRPWLRWTGLGLLGLVVVQGVMGAARVDLISTDLAVVHGITGQVFLALTVLVAAATSRVWIDRTRELTPAGGNVVPPAMRWLALGLLVALVVQLALGAWMRHHGAGLAIPDFPANYGAVLPPANDAALTAAIDAWAARGHGLRDHSLAQVWVHFAHRAWALAVTGLVLALVTWLNLRAPGRPETRWPARWLVLLLGVQLALGASVIWTGRYPAVATLHQATGAAVLAVAVWLTIRLHLLVWWGSGRATRDRQGAQTRSGADVVGA